MSQNHKYRRRRAIFALVLCTLLFSSTNFIPNQLSSLRAQSQACPPNAIERFGINVHRGDGKQLTSYDYESLNLGWYLDYAYNERSGDINGVQYAHVIRTSFDTSRLERAIGPIVDANPGALWLAGNEPDRIGQDGTHSFTAADYATFYHEVYTFLKDRDPTAQVAIAGVVQPTPLRLKYLDQVLNAYQAQYGTSLPVDVFNTHNFVMSERVIQQADSDIIWGAGIPPGFSPNDPAIRYLYPTEVWNIQIFKDQLRNLRQWMADNGYRNKPLIISEYGVLLPDYWDLNGVGTANFMIDSFDFMLSETDSSTGYPADGNRLVQKFSWFSLNFPDYSSETPNGLAGAVFEYENGDITPLGMAFRDYVADMITACNIAPTATPLPPTETPVPPTVEPDETPVVETPIPGETPTVDPGEPTATNTPANQSPEVTQTATITPTNGGGSANPPPTPGLSPTVTNGPGSPSETATAVATTEPSAPTATATVTTNATPGESATKLPGMTSTPTSTPLPTATPLAGPTPTSGVLTGLAYVDNNGNGVFDTDIDIPMSNALVTLTGTSVNGANINLTAVTAANGFYRFVNVPSGSYQIVIIAEGYEQSVGLPTSISIDGSNIAAPTIRMTKLPEADKYFIPYVFNR